MASRISGVEASLSGKEALEDASEEELRLCMGSADPDAKEKEGFGSDDTRATIGEKRGRVKEEIRTPLDSCPEDSKERVQAEIDFAKPHPEPSAMPRARLM
ncbi:unnamed protein product [Symbiodinium natans]|uniref:Uncharacterized protein n=1 Tax=Symbiodinium natans TaxID=878477 RepID=A0A812T9L2_9DINO|nr:unnamed protein product [Symbiodinium natans]